MLREPTLPPPWIASVVLGIGASVIILYFLAPITERTGAAGAITRTYDLIKLIPLAVAAGSDGPSVISATQASIIAALEAKRADQTHDVAQQQLNKVEETISPAGAADNVGAPGGALTTARAQIAAARDALAAIRGPEPRYGLRSALALRSNDLAI